MELVTIVLLILQFFQMCHLLIHMVYLLGVRGSPTRDDSLSLT